MFARVLHVLVPPSIPVRNLNHQAHNTEATELHMLTAKSNEDLSVKDRHAVKATESTVNASTKAGRLQYLRQWTQRFSGWRFGVLNFAIWTSMVFVINFIVTIWGSVAYDESILAQGECGRIKTLNSGIHVLINVLSTILLSGSNYCMQCLSAPTRGEVNKAHASGKWLDIGVPSLRNLRRISRHRLILWLLLGASSLPLHLLYNSAVYASLPDNDYKMFLVSQAFVDDSTCRNCTNAVPDAASDAEMLRRLWSMSRNGSLERLSPAQCVDAYGTMIQSSRRNLLVVTAEENVYRGPTTMPDMPWINNTNWLLIRESNASQGLTPYLRHTYTPVSWMCSGLPHKVDTTCADRLREIKNAPQNWSLSLGCSGGAQGYCDRYRWTVDYCLSEPAGSKCQLHFNREIAIIVSVLNFLKAVLMYCVVYVANDDPLMTVGDAVASFLDDRDPVTVNMGLLSIHNVKKKGYSASVAMWSNPRQRWKDTTSKRRRTAAIVMFIISIGTVAGLLIYGVRQIEYTSTTGLSDVFRLGFGAVDPRAIISGLEFPTDMALLALISNFPQLLLSFLYFIYNSLFTAMLMGYEWTSYATKRKGLRVSRKPSGSQRSTYFLQLPYRFGLPLIVLSGTLHWLLSQSIFVVAIDIYDMYGNVVVPSKGRGLDIVTTKTCGFSPSAMLSVVVVGFFLVAALIACGFIPYKGGMPLAGSSSLAISAACHPKKHEDSEETVLSEQTLQWGIVSTGVDGIGHCAFSSEEVGRLVTGRMYA